MMGGTGSVRALSRRAYPERWAERQRFRLLRRLSQQALRAKGRGDQPTMDRLGHILNRIAPNLFSDLPAPDQEMQPAGDEIVQKPDPSGQKEKGGISSNLTVNSRGGNETATDDEESS
jgi:hypothetical protein